MTEQIYVYIDGDNMSPKYCKHVIDKIKTQGNIITARIYGDWSESI